MLFSNYKFARVLLGGYWELWYCDHPVCSEIWFNTTNERRYYPSPLCRSNAIKIEDYRPKNNDRT